MPNLPLTSLQAKRIAETFCTSHTAVTNFDRCPRKRFIESYWDGYGIVSSKPSLPLLVGAAVHTGVEVLNRHAMGHQESSYTLTQPYAIQEAVKQAKLYYTKEVKAYIASLSEGMALTTQEKFSFNEGMALVEALILVYHRKVLPGLLTGYKIIAVEREHDIQPNGLGTTLVYQARIDAILEDRTNKDVYAWSLKTANAVDSRKKKFHEHDSQGMAESWVLDQMLAEQKATASRITEGIARLLFGPKITMQTGIPPLPSHCTGVIMCFLLKGKTWEEDPEYEGEPGLEYTNSPLVRGYRRQVGNETQYAHSKKFPNPENKSGYGYLGKGWEPFYPWQHMKIDKWIDMISETATDHQTGQQIYVIQPECGDVLEKQAWQPMPYIREQTEVDAWVEQTVEEEKRILGTVASISCEDKELVQYHQTDLAATFKQVRAACHYPLDCPCLPICFDAQTASDPLATGRFKYRTPHHETELALHTRWHLEDARADVAGPDEAKIDLDSLQESDAFKGGRDVVEEIEVDEEERS